MNHELKKLQKQTRKSLRKENWNNKKEQYKRVNELWKIVVVATIFTTWTYNYFEFKSLMADHARALQNYERVIERRHAEVVKPNEEAATEVTPANGETTEIDTPRQSRTVPEMICDTFPEDCDRMLAIAKAENRTLAAAPAPNKNNDGTIDCGLMQINSIHGFDCEWLENIENNLGVARKIYDTQGITAWSTYNSGKYLEFMQS